MPAGVFAVGTGPGTDSLVRVLDNLTGAPKASITPFPSYTGGTRVALGDVTGDGVPDVIAATAGGTSAAVKVFDGNSLAEVRSLHPFGSGYLGGLFVAAGDVNDDGFDDIIVGADGGALPHVKVFSGRDNTELFSFFAYGPGFAGGVRVGSGDVDGDGRADIITGAGPGSVPHVEVFSGAGGALIRSFFAFDPQFAGGVTVAGGDVDGDGHSEILVGAGAGAGPHVKLFDGAAGREAVSFFAFDPSFHGGISVGLAGDMNGDGFGELVVGAGPGAGPVVRVFDVKSLFQSTGPALGELSSFDSFASGFAGGVFIGTGAVNAVKARDDAATTDEDTPAGGNVLANDVRIGAGDPLAVSAVNGNAAAVGAPLTLASGARLTVNADGNFTYDPNGQFASLTAGETATDSFSYTASTGHGRSASATVTVTIRGIAHVPVVDSASVSPTSPTTSALLSATVTSHDADGQSVSLAFQWLRNGNPISGATGATLQLNPLTTQPGDQISVRVTPSDGTLTGAPFTSAPVTVVDSAPVVDSADVTPTSPTVSDTLTVTVTTHDPDGDAVTNSFQWLKDGNPISGATNQTLDLSSVPGSAKGHQFAVVVTPSDGTLSGTPFTSNSVTVVDSPPVVDSAVITPTSPTATSTLTVTVTSHDPDGDAVTNSFQWFQNNNPVSGATSQTLDLSTVPGVTVGDQFTVQVTPNDGTVNGSPFTSNPVTVV